MSAPSSTEQIPLEIFSSELLKPQHFDWAEESDELDQQVDDVHPSDILRSQSSLWADESEELDDRTNTTDGKDKGGMAAIADCEAEFKRRARMYEYDEDIHHFNWLGNPVYHSVTTPPAHSLAIIRAPPKAPTGSHMYRVTAIMNRAMQLVDPVLVDKDQDAGLVLELHGSELIRESEGHVFKFYSPHGSWVHDSPEGTRGIVPDYGTAARNCQFEIGNGLYEDGPLHSSREWLQWRAEMVAAAEAPGGPPAKLSLPRPPSLLRNTETVHYPQPEPEPTPPPPLSPTQAPNPMVKGLAILAAKAWSWVRGRHHSLVPASRRVGSNLIAIVGNAIWAAIQPRMDLFLAWLFLF
ncbi:uncharacterized protein N7515_008105 [Penicillium bovifimosum]|uniref:Uncharacterized protein n=1 Tax=Penicillium bovifimosum TaxID=126998 RepID=A0A9W9GMB0_9EURO|nr:uncharacterized protein N7515_008105 [Penicillium bovifimosum]KAJ5124280.1 hypothetical protein N7515_008105 [Penicillium bovifimosum]